MLTVRAEDQEIFPRLFRGKLLVDVCCVVGHEKKPNAITTTTTNAISTFSVVVIGRLPAGLSRLFISPRIRLSKKAVGGGGGPQPNSWESNR